jgi:hypothetical protein
MTGQHLITPPPELVDQWKRSGPADAAVNNAYECHIAAQAAQWGADQELEACCALLLQEGAWPWPEEVARIRAARRPKPLSFKKQALKALDSFEGFTGSLEEVDIIRRALESLPD